MADEEEEVQVTPRTEEEELSDQEKLKLELLQLQKMQATPTKREFPAPLPSSPDDKPVENQKPPEPVEAPVVEPVDLGKLSTAQIRPTDITPNELSPAKNVPVIQRSDYIKTARAPLANEIESNPQLKLRVAALLDLENPGAGPAVVESLLNRALYAKRSVDQMTRIGPGSFYGPARKPGMVEARMAEIARDPVRLRKLFDLVQQAYTSNTVRGNTDQGSLNDPNYHAGGIGENINRERFNDWGGGPGGHAGARMFRMALNARAGQPHLPIDELRAMMNPIPSAQQTDTVQGGGMESPKAVAQIAALMQGTPIEKIKAASELVRRAGVDRSSEITPGRRVATSRVSHTDMPQEIIPGAEGTVPQNTMPIPGMVSEGQNALLDATNPSMASTIRNYQALNAPVLPPPPVEDQINKPAAPPPKTFVQNLMSLAKSFNPTSWDLGDVNEKLADSKAQEVENQGAALAGVAQGLASGVQDLPVATVGGVVAPTAAVGGLLSGSDPLKQYAAQTAADMEEWKRNAQKRVGIDPNALTPPQSVGHQLGSNLGLGVVKTVFNAVMSSVAENTLGPAAAYMGKNYPIPNLNPISPANAATIFGAPPLIVNTPGGPVAMNDADLSQLAWGGIFALGFGSSIPAVAKVVRYARAHQPSGLAGVFDPRGEIPGAPGTWAASIPTDKFKAGVIDQGKALLDVADRQAKYEKGTQVGIDPLAANEVLQAWRTQTNSGAQNLIDKAIKIGEMNVPDYRFNVNTSIGKLVDFAKVKPQFPEYLRLKAIDDEIRFNTASNMALPQGSTAQPRPTFFEHNGVRFTRGTGAHTDVDRALIQLEHDNPDFAPAYTAYRDNLDATRDLISSHPTNNVENYNKITTIAVDRPTLPIFSEHVAPKKIFDQFLIGKNPLEVAEINMRKAFEKQMKFDAERRYIAMTETNVGSKAFTERDAAWMQTHGAGPRDIGAVLHRRLDGKDLYYTADPLLVSIMNSGHVPLSSMEQAFAGFKSVFQKTTTGAFAPWFAPTGMVRAMEQGWTTAPGGVKTAGGRTVLPAGPGSTAMGFLTRVGAQVSRPTGVFFRETVANSALGNFLTVGQADLIGRSFEKWYMDSFYRKMEISGAFNPDSVMEGKEVFKSIASARRLYGANPQMNPVIDFMEHATNTFKKFTWDPLKKGFYEPLNAGLTALQEAPAYGWARKVSKGADDANRPTMRGREMSDAEVAMHFRNYTGDPSTRGYIYEKGGAPIRFLADRGMPPGLNAGQIQDQTILRATWGAQDKAAELTGRAAHAARSVTPWAGVLFQSPSATLAAMRDNPVRANLAFAASHVLPEITSYFWNAYYSDKEFPVLDDTGAPVMKADGTPATIKYDYVNHNINGRNSHNLLNNTYFAVPGRPPNEGVEFRHYQEGAFNRYMTRMFAHQYYGKAYGTAYDDLGSALSGFLGTAVIPPLPSPLGAFLGSKGYVSTGGWVGGLFKSRYNPYVDLGGGESALELSARAIVPALADITLQAMQAGTNAPSWADIPTSVGKQVGHRVLGRTAIIGDAFGVKPDVSGSTVLSDELWTNKKVIDDLAYRNRVWDQGQGEVKTNKGSITGREHIKDYTNPLPPGVDDKTIANPGLQQKDPSNPLYKIMMGEMEKTFIKDEPKKGGIGYKSMWGRYGVWGQLAARMRTVNEGNAGVWVEEQLANPERMNWLRERNVNPLDFRAVKDFYQTERNKVTQVILQTIKATEQRMSKMPAVQEILKGKPFKVWMLDPDEPGLNADKAAEKELQELQ